MGWVHQYLGSVAVAGTLTLVASPTDRGGVGVGRWGEGRETKTEIRNGGNKPNKSVKQVAPIRGFLFPAEKS